MTDFNKETEILMSKLSKEELFMQLQSMNGKIDRLEQLISKAYTIKSPDAPKKSKEAMEHLKVCESTFRRIVASGEIPYSLSGKSKRFKVADLDAYLHRNSLSIGKGKGIKSLLSDANRKHQAV